MLIKKKLFGFPLAIFLAIIYTYFSLELINNPDYLPYKAIIENFNGITLSIEPIIGIITYVSIPISTILGIDITVLVYFIYILLMQLFLYFALVNIFGNALKSTLIVIFWFFIYGTVHFLIQIRFGLANCIFVYLYSLLFNRSSILKFISTSSLTFFSHYSSILSIIAAFIERFKNIFFETKSFYLFNLIFGISLILITKLNLLHLLPGFMVARLSSYLQIDTGSVSPATTIISIILYLLLFITKSINNRIDSMRMYGMASFLPYIISPEVEILVRLGIALQYLLIPYFFITYKRKKLLITSTLPLLLFFVYKGYSNISAFLSYL